jgi:hypothetical protein
MITSSIANFTTNILLHPENKFTIIPYWIPDLTILSIPFTESMAAGYYEIIGKDYSSSLMIPYRNKIRSGYNQN